MQNTMLKTTYKNHETLNNLVAWGSLCQAQSLDDLWLSLSLALIGEA